MAAWDQRLAQEIPAKGGGGVGIRGADWRTQKNTSVSEAIREAIVSDYVIILPFRIDF